MPTFSPALEDNLESREGGGALSKHPLFRLGVTKNRYKHTRTSAPVEIKILRAYPWKSCRTALLGRLFMAYRTVRP